MTAHDQHRGLATRRRFLQASSAAGAAAVGLTGGLSSALAQPSSGELSSTAVQPAPNPQGELPFLHGVASGDPRVKAPPFPRARIGL